MRHKFYIPIGMPTFDGPPTTAPQVGDTYFDRDVAVLAVRTWDGTKWVKGSGTLTAGNGLSGGGKMSGDIALNVNVNPTGGIKIVNDALTVDTAFTSNLYVAKAGSTMTGYLTLPNTDPTLDLHAATKRYVDTKSGVVNAYQVVAGAGLTGGGLIRYSPTFNIGQGWGITVAADQISVNQTTLNGAYSPQGHGHEYAPKNHTHALIGHTHTYGQVGIWVSNYTVGTINAGDTKKVTFTHNLKKTIRAASVTPYGDSSSALSLVCSVEEGINNNSTPASNVKILTMIKNIGNNQEIGCGISIILIY